MMCINKIKNKQMSEFNYSFDQDQLFEGLEVGDLKRLVTAEFSVDEYSSKIGSDEEILVLAFKVQGSGPAQDLEAFLEKSYDWILDADASSGELDNGNYLVFLEADRDPELAESIDMMLDDLKNLTLIDKQDWHFVCYKPYLRRQFTREEFVQQVPLTPSDYKERRRQYDNKLDDLRTAAGLKVGTQAPKNDFTESLRIAAGIR